MDTLSHDVIQSIVDSDCEDIFAYLGCHQVSPGYYAFRAFLPNADSVEVLDQKAEKTLLSSNKTSHHWILFERGSA